MKHFFYILLFASLLLPIALKAQTPYDSFAPETSRPMLEADALYEEIVHENRRVNTILCAALIDLQSQSLYIVSLTDGSLLASAPLADEVRKWLSVDPLVDKNIATAPYMYCLGNPIKYIDPIGMDEEQREAALNMAELYVKMNPGDSYERGAKGLPGEKVDCSGLVSRCIVAGGEDDPVLKGTGNGVRRIAVNSEKIENINDIVAGNLVTFDTGRSAGEYSHIGIITDINRDNEGNVVGFHFVHSGSKGPSIGYSDTNYWRNRVTGFYKWDTRPDSQNTPLYIGPTLQQITIFASRPIEATPLRTINVAPIHVNPFVGLRLW